MSRTPAVPGYVLVDRVHRGPFADVWRGSRLADERPVAVKVPAGTGGLVADEAAALRGVRHDNLLAVLDVVTLDDGRVVLVTDLAEGGSLADLVEARGHLTPGEAAAVVGPVAGALAALHAAGLVHGDLSASNVLFTPTARPLLADLGAAGAARALTGVWGTDGFVAPEVLAGGHPTAASDVFGLGALLVHCLTGRGVSPLEQADRVVRRCTDVADLPEGLEAVLRACIAGDAADRPAPSAVAEALGAVEHPDAVDIGGRRHERVVTYRVHAAAAPGRAAAARERPHGVAAGEERGSGALGRVRERVAAAVAPVRALPRPGRRTSAALLAGAVVVGGAAGVVAAGAPLNGLGGVVGGLLGVQVQGPDVAAAGSDGAGTSGPTPSVAASAAASPAASPTASPATVPGAARARPRELLQHLLTTRASALEAADAVALEQVDVPGSWAYTRDVSILGELATRQEQQSGLRFEVTAARVVSASEGRTLLEATVALGPYRYTRAGTTRTQAAGPPVRGRYELRWLDGRWRIDRVDPA